MHALLSPSHSLQRRQVSRAATPLVADRSRSPAVRLCAADLRSATGSGAV